MNEMYYLQYFVKGENLAKLAASIPEQTGAQKSKIARVDDKFLSSSVEYQVIIFQCFAIQHVINWYI